MVGLYRDEYLLIAGGDAIFIVGVERMYLEQNVPLASKIADIPEGCGCLRIQKGTWAQAVLNRKQHCRGSVGIDFAVHQALCFLFRSGWSASLQLQGRAVD